MRYAVCLGCGKLCAPGPRCSDCKRTRDRIYDLSRPATSALYRTAAWKRLSAEVRASSDRCHWCGKFLPPSKRVADHSIPVTERPDLFYQRDLIFVSCVACNIRRGRNLAPVRYRQPTLDELMARKARGS